MKTITLRGSGKNALSTAVMRETLAEVRAAKDDAIFLTGDGNAFSAGFDIKEVVASDAATLRPFLALFEELWDAIYRHPAPTVAYVNGAAVAGGCVLALAFDLRLAAPTAKIGLPEVALGLRFPPRIFAFVESRLTRPALERMTLEARLYDATESTQLGVVDEVIHDPALALERANAVASAPREAYSAAKAALRPAIEISASAQKHFEDVVLPQWVSPAQKERFKSVLR